MDEYTLIKLAKQNNQKALSILLSNNYNIVYGYILKLSRNEEIAKDITQDTMVKAITNISKFKSNSKFSTWLITIATNHYKNTIKKYRRMIPVSEEQLLCSLEINNKTLSIEDQYSIKEQFLQVINALDDFKDSQKMPFILRHYYGYSYDEIAIIVNCPIGTVRSRIHNVVKRLQERLGGGHNEKV